MNNRERVISSIHHQQPDKTPYHIGFTQYAHQRMAQYYNDPDFDRRLDNCFSFLNFERGYTEIKTNIFEDSFGVQWDRTVDKDIGTVCNCLITEENVDKFLMPDPDDPALYAGLESNLETSQGKFIMGYLGFSLFERAWTLAGMEKLMINMMLNPDIVNVLLDKILSYNLRVIKNALQFKIDGMMFGDDWGQQTGLLIGPQLWRKYIKPKIKQMYEMVKSNNRFVAIHSCGKIDELFPELIDLGVDIFNPFQPEVMDVFAAKQVFGNRISFYGGISTQRTLPYGTVDEVKNEINTMIGIVGKKGGYIIAPAHAIPVDAKPENVAVMIDMLLNQ